MALRLYAATSSQGKLRDFRAAAAAWSVAIEPLPALGTIPAPEEDGATFADALTGVAPPIPLPEPAATPGGAAAGPGGGNPRTGA